MTNLWFFLLLQTASRFGVVHRTQSRMVLSVCDVTDEDKGRMQVPAAPCQCFRHVTQVRNAWNALPSSPESFGIAHEAFPVTHLHPAHAHKSTLRSLTAEPALISFFSWSGFDRTNQSSWKRNRAEFRWEGFNSSQVTFLWNFLLYLSILQIWRVFFVQSFFFKKFCHCDHWVVSQTKM